MMYTTTLAFLQLFKIEETDRADLFVLRKVEDVNIKRVRINGIDCKVSNPCIAIYLKENRMRINSLGKMSPEESYLNLVFDEEDFVNCSLAIEDLDTVDITVGVA